MMKELFINGDDAYEKWGVSLGESALSELMTPPANKAFIENESRLQHTSRMLCIRLFTFRVASSANL